MGSQVQVFAGRNSDAESTVLPAISAWVDGTLEDACASGDNFSVVMFINCPGVGILGTEKRDFFVTAVTNLLNQYRRNAVAILVLPNRAGQTTRSGIGQIHRDSLFKVIWYNTKLCLRIRII